MRKPTLFIIFLFGWLLLMAQDSFYSDTPEYHEEQNLQVRFLGNAGILLQTGNQQIVIDGLFKKCLDKGTINNRTRTNLIKGKFPFDQLRLLLISSTQEERFHSKAVGACLKNHPQVKIIASEQTRKEIRKALYNKKSHCQPDILSVHPDQLEIYDFGSAKITAYPIHNKEKNRQDELLFLIQIAGKNILVMDDIQLSTANIKTIRQIHQPIDVAFIDYNTLEKAEGLRLIKRLIQPGQLVISQTPRHPAHTQYKSIMAQFPNAIVFRKPNELRIL